jgi:hypothetical protein
MNVRSGEFKRNRPVVLKLVGDWNLLGNAR